MGVTCSSSSPHVCNSTYETLDNVQYTYNLCMHICGMHNTHWIKQTSRLTPWYYTINRCMHIKNELLMNNFAVMADLAILNGWSLLSLGVIWSPVCHNLATLENIVACCLWVNLCKVTLTCLNIARFALTPSGSIAFFFCPSSPK